MIIILVAGLASLLVIAIHMLSRGRARPLPFGDLALFRERGAQTRRLARLRNPLLLLLRLALLVALAAWLWRPATTHRAPGNADALPIPAVVLSPLAVRKSDLSPALDDARSRDIAPRLLAAGFPPLNEGSAAAIPAFALLDELEMPRTGDVTVYIADDPRELTAVAPDLPSNVRIRPLPPRDDVEPLRIGVARSRAHPDQAEALWRLVKRLSGSSKPGISASCHRRRPSTCDETPDLWFDWGDRPLAGAAAIVRVRPPDADGPPAVPHAPDSILGWLPTLKAVDAQRFEWRVDPQKPEAALLPELRQVVRIAGITAATSASTEIPRRGYAWPLPLLIILLWAAERLLAGGVGGVRRA